MIVVFVGHDYRVEITWRQTPATQTGNRVTQAETAVEQDTRSTRFDDETVALAAAAQ
jgi:hypothetical protein